MVIAFYVHFYNIYYGSIWLLSYEGSQILVVNALPDITLVPKSETYLSFLLLSLVWLNSLNLIATVILGGYILLNLVLSTGEYKYAVWCQSERICQISPHWFHKAAF